jgi:hypothetical protein
MAKAMGATPKTEIERHLALVATKPPADKEAEDLAAWQRQSATLAEEEYVDVAV